MTELKDKQKRKVMSFLEKVKVLDKLDRRLNTAVVIHQYDVNIVFLFHVSHTVHYKIINWRKITNKCTVIVFLFLNFFYFIAGHVSAVLWPSSGCLLYGTVDE
jgi:hypothetical protein